MRPKTGSTWATCLRFLPAILSLIILPAEADDNEALALAVKATYLYKFAPFVEWSSPAAEFPSGAFVICVIGADPFGGLLDRAVAGQTVEGHPIVIRRYTSVSSNPGCSVAYVTGSASESRPEILRALSSAPVLTVTDGATDQQAEGIVNLVLLDGHVRFALDNQAAIRRGLRLSSKLLSLSVGGSG